ncbi:MAG: SDR family NAD(P)-dependent oxidoreductase [Methyloversatilis sp.]|jgi:NAD(P)-dependent dehydrogenase (short-subunit alcohol dehydrogenase family)|uniref:3-oxoacyl-[acyl-carrier-protein] reductase n=1 Tax=Methyloversatilis universalis (strain ATCC BAA-1314 / DSM 25237 / JCM 13912 / CCUG 52030 / FAM5) TaxID=1000565 RepID=F5R7X5_METUF|nr:SDR family NAD(P)-dependent oxidoreductase [Methyloversatilis universalis]EGK73128.1 Putative 3-oxoacyl-[acyl-carrier-protein] reductase [Methyloversatilis universalis FAM5]MCP4635068.1 SDR family NAD(P)-dependent oxidoreductase [Methyloversatilis sp.]
MFGPLNPPLADWAGKRVWVIGASSGIGAALARKLLRAGARVALTARDAVRVAEVAGLSPLALPLPLDVSEPGALQDATAELRRQWGGLDAVFFVAARYGAVRAWELDGEDIDATLRTNVAAVMHGCAAVLPGMLERGSGALVIVSSVAGYRGLPKALVYGASKAALINFAEALYLDLHPRGLGVHLVCPGFVETPLTANNDFHMPALISPDEAADHILSGMAHGDFHIHFPKRFTAWLRLMRLLPYRLYFAAVRRVTGL